VLNKTDMKDRIKNYRVVYTYEPEIVYFNGDHKHKMSASVIISDVLIDNDSVYDNLKLHNPEVVSAIAENILQTHKEKV
tara:strand:- start:4371 stop:4607 length:237 start_codon:yes stop_codon:yes gene_type:complete